MWWPSTERWDVYITGSQIRVRQCTGLPGRRRRQARPTVSFNEPADLPRALQRALEASSRGAALHLFFGSAWTRFAVLDSLQGVHAAKDRQTVALAHFQRQLGLAEADWTAATSLGHAHVVATALKKSVWEAARAAAARHALRIVAAQPMAAFAHDHIARLKGPKPDTLLVREDDALTTWVGGPNAYRAAQALPFDGSDEVLEAECQRLSLTFGIEPAQLRIIRILATSETALAPSFIDCIR